MKPEIKKLWVDALRSGEYKQGRCFLRSKDNRWCCLGVLSELYRIVTGNGKWLDYQTDVYILNINSLEAGSLLPRVVAEWAGLKIEADGRLQGCLLGEQCATFYNDRGYTFEHIADLIEEYL